MKTSIKLLCLLAVVTLTGMVSINVLLKKQYDLLDWSNPYQSYISRPLPALRHVHIVGKLGYQVLIRQHPQASVLINPDFPLSKFQVSQRGDTLLIKLSAADSNATGPVYEPWDEWEKNQPDIALNLPELNSLEATNVRIAVDGFSATNLSLTSRHALLKTKRIRVPGSLAVQAQNGSIVRLNADTCGVLLVTARDSVSVSLDKIDPVRILPTIAPKAELRVRGQQVEQLQANTKSATE